MAFGLRVTCRIKTFWHRVHSKKNSQSVWQDISFLYTFLFIFWAKIEMKLTFSCHYHQLGQKNPTQCYQTEINQLNLGIYLKKKWIGLMFLQKQKLRLKLPKQLCLVQYWTVFFTGLKLIRILSIFLNYCGKREQQRSVCTGYNIKASFTVEPTEALSVVFSESMEVLHTSHKQSGLWWTHGYITLDPLSNKHSIFYTFWPLSMCNFYIFLHTK